MSKMITGCEVSIEGHRDVQKYKERAALLFQKLQNLQQGAEIAKSSKQNMLLLDFDQTEKKIAESTKSKEGWYSKILAMVGEIDGELRQQKNQEEKCRRAVKTWVQSTERQLNNTFDRLQKQKIKSEAALQKFIESKLQSFVLKNKNAWNQSSLIDPQPYLQEINYLTKQHQKYLGQMQKQCDKLKKQVNYTLKEYMKMVEQEIVKNQEDQVTSFMKTVHMDISTKLISLKQQRERTEERVLSVLQKVVTSCISESRSTICS